MKTTLISKNVVINGFRTSLRLEQEIWEALEEICDRERLTLNELCSFVDTHHSDLNRTSAIRTFVVAYLRAIATRARRRKAWRGRIVLAEGDEMDSASVRMDRKLERLRAARGRPAQEVRGNA